MHSESVHEHTNHTKIKTAINTSDYDQIDSSIIFDDPYVENNGGEDEHDSNAHGQSVAFESLLYNVQKEAKNNIMSPRVMTRSAGRPAAESLGGGTGVRVGRGGRGRRLRGGNDERVDDLNGQINDQGMGANGGVEGVNRNVERANRGAPDFSTIIAQQLQNLLPAMLAQREYGQLAPSVPPATPDHVLDGPCSICFNCNRPRHLARDCRGVPRNVNPDNARNSIVRACYECESTDHIRSACPRLNRARGPEENRPSQVTANNGGQCRGNQGNRIRGRAICWSRAQHIASRYPTTIDNTQLKTSSNPKKKQGSNDTSIIGVNKNEEENNASSSRKGFCPVVTITPRTEYSQVLDEE
ncbi:putative reverse transcriptase domain-containing protein [Tanacetum coccineum]